MIRCVRTTLTLDPDVAVELERRRREGGKSLKEEVNHLLRVGLRHADAAPEGAPFRTEPASLGRLLVPIDDVSAALDLLDEEDARL